MKQHARNKKQHARNKKQHALIVVMDQCYYMKLWNHHCLVQYVKVGLLDTELKLDADCSSTLLIHFSSKRASILTVYTSASQTFSAGPPFGT